MKKSWIAVLLTALMLAGCSMGMARANLTNEEAQQIALEHAGLKESQVTRLKTQLEYDNGIPEYNVEFYYEGWEYDYELNAQTGEILEWDKEMQANGK